MAFPARPPSRRFRKPYVLFAFFLKLVDFLDAARGGTATNAVPGALRLLENTGCLKKHLHP